jgi:hypothetical protein
MSVSLTAEPAAHPGVQRLTLVQRFTAVMHLPGPTPGQPPAYLQQLGLNSVCIAANTSTVYVPDVADFGCKEAGEACHGKLMQPGSLTNTDAELRGEGPLRVYDLASLGPTRPHAHEALLNLVPLSDSAHLSRIRQAPTLTSSVLGKGMHTGVLMWQISPFPASEGGAHQAQALCIQQLVPWYLQLWLHTLHVRIGNMVSMSA